MNRRHQALLIELRAVSPQYPPELSEAVGRYLSQTVIDLQDMVTKGWVEAIPDPSSGSTTYINGKAVTRKKYAITETGREEVRMSEKKLSPKERLFGAKGKVQPS